MTYYEKEAKRIRNIVFSNQAQLDRILATKQYLDKNFETNVDLEVLSNIHCLSKYHLLRLFKRYFGQTPRQYLIAKRIQKSKEYLTKGMTVTETCFAVGFESLSSFSSLFKRKTGSTPLDFRKEQFSISKSTSNSGTCKR